MRPYTLEAKRVYNALSRKQKLMIKKGWPYKSERDALISELRQRGVLPHVLAELSGLSRRAIWGIAQKPKKLSNNELLTIKEGLNHIQQAAGRLGSQLDKLQK